MTSSRVQVHLTDMNLSRCGMVLELANVVSRSWQFPDYESGSTVPHHRRDSPSLSALGPAV